MATAIYFGVLFFMLLAFPVAVRYADCDSEAKPFFGRKEADVNSGAKFG